MNTETPLERMRRECAAAIREHELTRLMGEEGFRPLRAPEGETCREEDTATVLPSAIPGARCVNGVWLYSDRWL